MAIWSADLTTEDGALGAAQMGSIACLISAGFAGFYLLVFLGLANSAGAKTELAVPAWFFAIELGVFGLAALRMRSGKGELPGIFAAIFLGLEVFAKLAALALLPLMFDIVLLMFTLNGVRGVRGVRALRRGIVNEEEIFS